MEINLLEAAISLIAFVIWMLAVAKMRNPSILKESLICLTGLILTEVVHCSLNLSYMTILIVCGIILQFLSISEYASVYKSA